MFQRASSRRDTQRVFILLVDGRPTQNEATILARAQALKNIGVRILPVIFGDAGFINDDLWRRVSSSDFYVSIPRSQYSQFSSTYLGRIHNYACGKYNTSTW